MCKQRPLVVVFKNKLKNRGENGALRWPLCKMAAEFPVDFSCRETGTPPERPPVSCSRGGKKGFYRAFTAKFYHKYNPEASGDNPNSRKDLHLRRDFDKWSFNPRISPVEIPGAASGWVPH